MKIRKTSITPAMAKAILDAGSASTDISATVAADIESGAFELNAEPIRLSKDGRLLDGRSRIIAG